MGKIVGLIAIVCLLFSGRPETKITYYYNHNLIEIKAKKTPLKADVILLAKLLESEAKNEPQAGIIAVGEVVLNRMRINNRTLEQVVFRRGQFDGVKTKYFRAEPSKFMQRLAYLVLDNQTNLLPGDIYFYHNKQTATDRKWIRALRSREYKDIGNHTFCHRKVVK